VKATTAAKAAGKAVIRAIFDDFWWKLGSLAVAVVMWLVVSSEPELSTFVSVPVQYKDLPSGLEINSDLIESVYLELRGPSGELRGGPDSRRYAVVLDMSAVRPGEQTFTIGDHQVRLPRGIRMMRAVPSQIRFEFERQALREIPVHVRFEGPAESVARYRVEPSALRIEGPASRVQRVKALVTDPVPLSGVTGNRQYSVNTFVDDPHVRIAAPSQVQVTVEMKRK
jgi:hypothetical protein